MIKLIDAELTMNDGVGNRTYGEQRRTVMAPRKAGRVLTVWSVVQDALNDLKSFFTEDCELTLIVRKPGDDEADILISNDDLKELEKLIARCRARVSVELEEGNGTRN